MLRELVSQTPGVCSSLQEPPFPTSQSKRAKKIKTENSAHQGTPEEETEGARPRDPMTEESVSCLRFHRISADDHSLQGQQNTLAVSWLLWGREGRDDGLEAAGSMPIKRLCLRSM